MHREAVCVGRGGIPALGSSGVKPATGQGATEGRLLRGQAKKLHQGEAVPLPLPKSAHRALQSDVTSEL